MNRMIRLNLIRPLVLTERGFREKQITSRLMKETLTAVISTIEKYRGN